MLKQCLLPVVFGRSIILVILCLFVYFLALHDTLWLHVISVCFIPLVILISSALVTRICLCELLLLSRFLLLLLLLLLLLWLLLLLLWLTLIERVLSFLASLVTYIHLGRTCYLANFLWPTPMEGILSFLASSVSYIRLCRILLLSQFFVTYTHGRDLVIFGFISNLHPSRWNLVT